MTGFRRLKNGGVFEAQQPAPPRRRCPVSAILTIAEYLKAVFPAPLDWAFAVVSAASKTAEYLKER
jgi:hypothetical protein